jgi:Zn finger protein HypA/HybF involved in hydrogenase expression
MHDLHLANQIVNLAKEYAHGRKIKSIAIELGDIFEHGENITLENLNYNIRLLLPATKVEIKRIKNEEWRLKEIEIV